MTKECAQYLNETAGKWNKAKSDAAIAKLEKMNAKTYVFTVTDCENSEKPTIFCKLTTDRAVKDQDTAEKLIADYADEYFEDYVAEDELEELAYTMRKNGAAWLDEQFCFELTEVNG